MNVDVQQAVKPLRKLRKLLKDVSVDATPEAVHRLRTRMRRVEASVHALVPQRDPAAERLLKHLKPMRKAAGKVRDMDVLFSKLCALGGDGGAESVIQLGQHLSRLRQKHADRLRHIVRSRGPRVRRELKRFARMLERRASQPGQEFLAPQGLANRLEHWPKLSSRNLHEFRICAKELRYMLELAKGASQRRLHALDRTKDVAGEWHDWVELRAIAAEVLDAQADREIFRRIDAITRGKLHDAIGAANQLRGLNGSQQRAA